MSVRSCWNRILSKAAIKATVPSFVKIAEKLREEFASDGHPEIQ